MTVHDNPEVSIIVPAYNIETYLHECLDSLGVQTFRNFECIVVNDGSTDSTEKIASKYAKSDPRFRVITKQNGGLSSARNAGFQAVKGKFVLFLDGDDFFAPDLVASLRSSSIKNNADIAVGNFKLFYESMKKFSDPRIDFRVLGSKQGTFSYKTHPDLIYAVPQFMVWNKLFTVDFLRSHDIWHNETSHRAEDIDFVGRALVMANTVSYVDKPLSFYRTGVSTSNVSTSYKYPFDVLDSLSGLSSVLVKKDLYQKVKNGFLVMAVTHILASLYFTEMYPVHKQLYKRSKEFLEHAGARDLPEHAFFSKKDYTELQLLLDDTYEQWLRYRITDLRDNREANYISYLLGEYQRKFKEESMHVKDLERQLNDVYDSISWKVTKPLRVPKHFLDRLKQ